jgi:hypothetical protein
MQSIGAAIGREAIQKKRIRCLIILCAPRHSWGRTRYPKLRQKLDRFGGYFACGRIIIVSDHMKSIGAMNGREAIRKTKKRKDL